MTIADMAYKKYMFNINIHLDGIIMIDDTNQVRDGDFQIKYDRYIQYGTVITNTTYNAIS